MRKIELIKTERKECGATVYDVRFGTRIIGRAFRKYYASAGAWCASYVGHWKGGYEWALDLDYVPQRMRIRKNQDEGYFDFASFKELKKFLEKRSDERK